MQDLKSTTAALDMQTAPSAGGLPDGLAEKVASADVLILLGSSEENELALTVRTILASPTFEPGHVASHAYAHAVQLAHQDLLRSVRGEPTDADRYRALRAFGELANTDPARFEVVNSMLQHFEEHSGLPDENNRMAPDFDKVGDFLVHALAETEHQVGAEQPAAT